MTLSLAFESHHGRMSVQQLSAMRFDALALIEAGHIEPDTVTAMFRITPLGVRDNPLAADVHLRVRVVP